MNVSVLPPKLVIVRLPIEQHDLAAVHLIRLFFYEKSRLANRHA